MNLLLMSSSRSATTDFLEANEADIKETLAGVKRALFIPYAVTGEMRRNGLGFVGERFSQLGLQIDNIDDAANAVSAVNEAEAVLVSGGNTFCLLHDLYANELVEPLRKRVRAGVPYIGWSAGSNVAGRTIRTTNDMPIVYPPTFDALGLVPFQLNPHFTDAMPAGLRGETREQRLSEFLAVNPNDVVVGLPEGCALRRRDSRLTLRGEHDAWLFRAGETRQRLLAGRDLSHLL